MSGASFFLDVLYLLAALALTPYFLWRRIVRQKLSAGMRSRLGWAPERPANTQRIWIHAVSVGEALAAEPLIKALSKRMPECDIVISTTTVTGQNVAIQRYGKEQVFFYPHDLSWAVKRALDRIKPSVLVLMELEVWPNMSAEAVRRGIPIVVVNGRVTERSARRYKRFWILAGPAFLRVKRWLVQSDEYAKRLLELGVNPQTIEIGGNIKYDAIETALPEITECQARRASLSISPNARILVGGSTHPSEEAALLAAYSHLRRQPGVVLRLILAPRHPERIKDVEKEIALANCVALKLSEIREKGIKDCLNGLPAEAKDSWVLLVDTMGELKQMYKLADVAFVGGSLISHGGQNVMEPCGLGLPVIHGPHMHNFKDAMTLLKGCDGSIEVSREGLLPALERLLADPDSATAMGARAREAFLSQQGATERAVEYICGLLHY